MNRLYLKGLLFCIVFQAIVDSALVENNQHTKGANQQQTIDLNKSPIKINLNRPPPIEENTFTGADKEGSSIKRKKVMSELAHHKKLERDREYRAKFSIKNVNEALPFIKNEEQKNKLMQQADIKRMQARARQQKRRDQRKERQNNNQLTEKDQAFIQNERQRSRKRVKSVRQTSSINSRN